MWLRKKNPLVSPIFYVPPQICSFLVLNWEIRDSACSSHSPASQGLDPGLAPCTGKATDPTAPTLHLKGMLIQTKPKGSKTTMAVLGQMALCCLWKLKIDNPEVRTRKCSNTAEALHMSACLQVLARDTLGLNTSPPSRLKWQVLLEGPLASTSRSQVRWRRQLKHDVGLIMDTNGIL